MFFLIGILPRTISLAVAGFAGKIAFRVVGKYRDKAISNLDSSLDGGHDQNVQIAEKVFQNLAKNGVEWLKMMYISKSGLFSLVSQIEGFHHLEKALEKRKGVIVVASHFGNWELMPIYLKAKGYKGAVIARRIYFRKYDKMITKLRNRFGPIVIYRDESPKKILRVLKNNGILGILADQDMKSVESVFVDFFGKPAYTPVAPVKLAMATGAVLMPGFMMRLEDNSYKFILEDPIEISESMDKQADVVKYTQAWTDVLERYIRKYPDQWVWLHDRWKTKPEDADGDRVRVENNGEGLKG